MGGKETMTVEAGGRTYEVDAKALRSWSAFDLVRKMDAGSEMAKVTAAIDFVGLVCGVSEQELVDACGGDGAEAADVIALVFEIIKGCYPKN